MSDNNLLQINKLTKTKYGYNLFFNDEKINVEEIIVAKYKIIKGQVISQTDLNKILKDNQTELIKRKSILYLQRKRSVLEFKTYLRTLKASNSLIESLTEQYKKRGYLNDTEYALSLIEKLETRYGITKIKSELIKKGIHKDIIDDVLNNYQTSNTEYNIEKICKTIKAPTYKLAKEKAFRSLLSRGYTLDNINNYLDMYLKEEDFDQTKTIKIEYDKLVRKYKNKENANNKIKSTLYLKGYDKYLIEKIMRGD